jgi:hypothetical protein
LIYWANKAYFLLFTWVLEHEYDLQFMSPTYVDGHLFDKVLVSIFSKMELYEGFWFKSMATQIVMLRKRPPYFELYFKIQIV